ncbi:aldo/keto reductase [Microbacterium sp. SORGH_AS_0421]|uniref:aldo/keto reductase n=1 Tax=Microbacterium sp. SORGH_AS_0421 TaxID=3041768 RepID=UPI00278EBB6E|nr:2,5-diketo-D-gluconate reductase A [Microbacterium sp. SORGH_AS_0421]
MIVPPIGFGTWGLRSNAVDLVCSAVDLGYRFIDTASAYVNERDVGVGIKQSSIDRSDITVCSKFPVEFCGRENDVLAFSLRSLNIEYLDLWLLHGDLPDAQFAHSWPLMIKAKERGLVREIGVCNLSLERLEWMRQIFGGYPAFHQTAFPVDVRISAFARWHRSRSIQPIAHSVLKRPNLAVLGDDRGRMERVVGAFVSSQTSFLIGSSDPGHIHQNLLLTRQASIRHASLRDQ